MESFNDKRSKSLILLPHCLLNQNSISDSTADYPAMVFELIKLINNSEVGILQMPCPELNCLGLDRGDAKGGLRPLIEENSRIRNELIKELPQQKMKTLVQTLIYQIEEYLKHGFEIKGIIGINRSPSCGIETTSKENEEVKAMGVFMEVLHQELHKKGIKLPSKGIKVHEMDDAIKSVKALLA